jgi:F-type H+-transporting ATPase subunit epsilon
MADTRQPEPTVQSAVDRMMPSIASEIADSRPSRVRCVIVTPERAVLDETAEMVILPMFDGELGVLQGRAPLVGRLGAGELRLKTGGVSKRWYVEAGFVQVRSNVVKVLTANARPASEITSAMAEAARAEAEALPAGTAVERASKAKARDRAQGMKKVAGRGGHAAGAPGDMASPGSHATA